MLKNNKVSPVLSSESFPLTGDNLSSSSTDHFDDNGHNFLYSKLPRGSRPSYASTGGKLRQNSIFDYSDLIDPVMLDSISPCTTPVALQSEDSKKKCTSQKILHYLADLHHNSSHEEVDIARLEALLATGADINASTGKGFTSLHQSVVRFPVRVAQWLVTNGADVERVDQWGWSALHLACIENRPDIVELLCKKNCNILYTQTRNMKLTPLHIAALSDTNDVTSELVHYMKDSLARDPNRDVVFRDWLESRDYQGRTALHLATQYDRNTSARYLLEHSLAHPATLDSQNQFCLVQMIEKMSLVSAIALDKFYLKDTLSRKQVFFLNFMEKETNLDISRTPLDSVVQYKRFELIVHPIFKRLLRIKWRMYGRAFAIFQIVFYLVSLIFWSLFTVHPPKESKYQYNLPADIWRIAVGFICLAFLLLQIIEEFSELTKDASEQMHFRKKMRIVYRKDKESFPTYLSTEHEHIDDLLKDLNRFKNPYTGDFWNYIDWVAYFLMTATAISHIVDVFAHTTVWADWHARISVVSLIIIWFRLLKFLRPFEFIGWFIAILIYLTWDIVRFLIFILVLVIPYSIGFWVLFQFVEQDIFSFHSATFTVFRMIVVDDYPYHEMRRSDEWMTFLFVGSYISIVSIISLNLFIALLSNTFQAVYDNSQANAIMEKARILLNTERKLPYRLMKFYYNHIINKCAPLIENFDDDTNQASDEGATKLATLNILSTVNRMESTLKHYVKHDRSPDAHQFHRDEDETLDATRFENLLFALNENLSNMSASIDSLSKKVVRIEEKLGSTAPELRHFKPTQSAAK